MIKLDDKIFKILLKGIQKGECVVFLGEDIPLLKEGKCFRQVVKDIKLDYFGNERQSIIPDIDDFYVFANAREKDDLATLVAGFCEENTSPLRLHKLIASINFPLIISLTPDKLMYKAFPKGTCQMAYYYHKNENEELEKISNENPLVYNLFGSIDDSSSILLSNDDLLDYLFSIIGAEEGKSPMNLEVKTILKNAKFFIFLGFDYNKWYMRVLFRYFDIKDKTKKADRHYRGRLPKTSIFSFYENNFGFDYFDASAEEIMETIYQKALVEDETKNTNLYLRFKLSENEEMKPIRSLSEKEIKAELILKTRDLIAKANLKDAIICFAKVIELYAKTMQNDFILLQSQYNGNENKCDKNLVSNSDYEQEKSRITQSLLNMIDQICENGEV